MLFFFFFALNLLQYILYELVYCAFYKEYLALMKEKFKFQNIVALCTL